MMYTKIQIFDYQIFNHQTLLIKIQKNNHINYEFPLFINYY